RVSRRYAAAGQPPRVVLLRRAPLGPRVPPRLPRGRAAGGAPSVRAGARTQGRVAGRLRRPRVRPDEMSARVRVLIGDVRRMLAQLPADHYHCVVTSPPFWALRAYLPADHPCKSFELGSEPTPRAYIESLVE